MLTIRGKISYAPKADGRKLAPDPVLALLDRRWSQSTAGIKQRVRSRARSMPRSQFNPPDKAPRSSGVSASTRGIAPNRIAFAPHAPPTRAHGFGPADQPRISLVACSFCRSLDLAQGRSTGTRRWKSVPQEKSSGGQNCGARRRRARVSVAVVAEQRVIARQPADLFRRADTGQLLACEKKGRGFCGPEGNSIRPDLLRIARMKQPSAVGELAVR